MKIIQFIQQWWLKLKSKRKAKKEAEHANHLKMISCTSINVMEFSGKLYVSYNGVPIVNVERLNINCSRFIGRISLQLSGMEVTI